MRGFGTILLPETSDARAGQGAHLPSIAILALRVTATLDRLFVGSITGPER